MNADTPTPSPDDFPNAARIYDYTLGGTLNREVDRQAAEYMFSLLPSTRKWVRMLRAFLQQAARDLYAEGFDQFLDLGSGLPTEDHVHHAVPSARVVYVDNDPTTVQQAQTLLQNTSNATYLEGNLMDLKSMLHSPAIQQTLDLTKKVAIGLNGISVFFQPDELHTLAQSLYEWAPEGSQIYITYETKEKDESTPTWEQFIAMFTTAGSPMYVLSLEENEEAMRPWRTIWIKPVADYLGMPEGYITEADREGVGVEFWAARLGK